MDLIYIDDAIVEVRILNAILNTKITQEEKLTFFACAHPNPTVWQNISWIEINATNEDGTPKTTLQLTVQSMVTEGLITQQRANEILA